MGKLKTRLSQQDFVGGCFTLPTFRQATLNELSSITPGLLALSPRLDVPLDRSRRRLLELPLAAGRERRLIGRLPPRTASRDRLTR